MKDAESAQRRPRPYRKHGITRLKQAVSTLGNRSIDRRTSIGRALAAWRAELLADLGGIESVTTQELALIEEAVKTKLILDSVDAWLLSQPSLINKRSRSVLPVVRDRQALVSTLRGLLGDLGLGRRTKAMPALNDYLAQHGTEPPAPNDQSLTRELRNRA
jgi:hypothetical protein